MMERPVGNLLHPGKNIILALLSGAALVLSLPGLGISWPVWIAIIPLLIAGETSSPLRGFLTGFIAGLVVAGVVLGFMPSAAQGIGLGVAFSWIAFLALISYYGLYIGVFSFTVAFVSKRLKPGRNNFTVAAFLILIPSIWTGLEFIHSRLLPGLPWTFIFLGYFLWENTILIQIADITGIFGLSFLIVLVNTGIYLSVTRRMIMPATVAGIGIILCLFYGKYKFHSGPVLPDKPELRVAVLQASIPAGDKWNDEKGELIAERYLSLCLQAEKFHPDLVIWTETAIPWPVAERDELVEEALKITRGSRSCHIIGNPVAAEKGGFFNSALLVLPDGRVVQRYDKNRLLSFVESSRSEHSSSRRDPGGASYQPGRDRNILNTPRGKAGISICNENFYPEMIRESVRDGAEFLINLTNDAWWPDRFRLTGHFLFNIFRAVENRRAMVVASNVGISALIDERGVIIKQSPLRQPYTLTGKIGMSSYLTFYTRYGDLFACGSLLISGVGIIAFIARKWKP